MKDEFVTCGCDSAYTTQEGAKARRSKMWASALAGFVAGAIVATTVLLPWLFFESMLVEHEKVPPAPATQEEINDEKAMLGDEVMMAEDEDITTGIEVDVSNGNDVLLQDPGL